MIVDEAIKLDLPRESRYMSSFGVRRSLANPHQGTTFATGPLCSYSALAIIAFHRFKCIQCVTTPNRISKHAPMHPKSLEASQVVEGKPSSYSAVC
jgi:hypothetical protein